MSLVPTDLPIPGSQMVMSASFSSMSRACCSMDTENLPTLAQLEDAFSVEAARYRASRDFSSECV
jgi:hypothetical protein